MILLCIQFVQVFWVSGVFENRSDVAVFIGFSYSAGESILNSFEEVYFDDV